MTPPEVLTMPLTDRAEEAANTAQARAIAMRFREAHDAVGALAQWLRAHGHTLAASTVDYLARTLDGIGAGAVTGGEQS